MPELDDVLADLTDEELQGEIRREQAELDDVLREADGSPQAVEEVRRRRARIDGLVRERLRREAERMSRGLRSGGTVDGPGVDEPPDPEGEEDEHLHGKLDPNAHLTRLRALEVFASELGVPCSVPLDVDLSDQAVYEEHMTELYSLKVLADEVAERQQQSGGWLQGAGSGERVMEAVRQVIASGRFDDAFVGQLSRLLDPEALKWLPLFIGLAAGLGWLGPGVVLVGGLVLAFGPAVWSLVSAVYDVVNAANEEEFAAAVGELTEALAQLSVDLVIALASFGLARGYRAWRGPKGGSPEAGPKAPPPSRLPATAPAGGAVPRRVRPPWFGEPKSPLRTPPPLPLRPSSGPVVGPSEVLIGSAEDFLRTWGAKVPPEVARRILSQLERGAPRPVDAIDEFYRAWARLAIPERMAQLRWLLSKVVGWPENKITIGAGARVVRDAPGVARSPAHRPLRVPARALPEEVRLIFSESTPGTVRPWWLKSGERLLPFAERIAELTIHHAEQQLLRLGGKWLGIGATRGICPHCAAQLGRAGVTALTPYRRMGLKSLATFFREAGIITNPRILRRLVAPIRDAFDLWFTPGQSAYARLRQRVREVLG